MATQNQYDRLAAELIATIVDGVPTYERHIALPIKMIDGVRTDCMLKLEHIKNHKKNEWSIIVAFTADNPFPNPVNEHYLVNLISSKDSLDNDILETEVVADLIKNIFQQISSLKYDNGCRLIKHGHNRHEYVYDICNIPNITLSGDKCCVCLEMTESETKCGHHLCLQCWAKLKLIKGWEDEDEDEAELSDEGEQRGSNCPMCRKFMKMH